MNNLGKTFIFIGTVIFIIGIIILVTNKIFPEFKLGNLPGDIKVKKENFSFYFPITTCIIISIIISLILRILKK
jgi:hypothetical protein